MVKFIIDSAADVLPCECERLGVTHVPLKVLFGSAEYRDGVDLTHEAFYEKLAESDVLPTTSQVSPAEFADALQPLVAAGHEVVVITLSGKLSGTYQSACIAAADFEGVYVVDSLSVSLGERILLQRGLVLAEGGMDAAQIAATLDAEKTKVRVLALLDTLEYLKKGGRISAATALAGSLLSIKPVIALHDGAVTMVGKARGSRQGNNLLRQLVEKYGGIDFSRPYCVAYSGLSDALMNQYILDSSQLYRDHEAQLQTASVGCTIGTHVGPGVVAVTFFQN